MTTSPLTGPADTVRLAADVDIPVLGLGVYRARAGRETADAVSAALEAGYRHVDTAKVYRNESDVAAGIRAAVRSRDLSADEVFVTTKLWNADHGHGPTLAAFEGSRRRLERDVIDLYLVHWPVPELRLQTWLAMEELLEAGKVRAIGVSNYMVRHLEELLAVATHPPAVNQIELSPFNYRSRRDVLDLCAERGILVEAYSPLTKGRRLGDPTLTAVAETHGVTPAQVLIRWALQKGTVVLPKSANPARIAANADVFGFALPAADMDRLDALDEGLATGWDPTDAP